MEPNKDIRSPEMPRPEPKAGLHHVRRALSFTLEKAKQAKDVLIPHDEKIALDDINEDTVAKVIDSEVYNPLRASLGQDPRSDFDVPTILKGLGYISPLPTDYFAKFPNEYRLTRISLLRLHKEGVLEAKYADEPASVDGERMIFRVADEDKFKDFLAEAAQREKDNKSAKPRP